MLDHDYTTKETFNKNFFKDWRKVMTEKEKEKLRDLSKCDFSEINEYFKKVSEERKGRSKEEKKAEKAKNDELTEHYGFCEIDGHKEKIGNFRIEPPGKSFIFWKKCRFWHFALENPRNSKEF